MRQVSSSPRLDKFPVLQDETSFQFSKMRQVATSTSKASTAREIATSPGPVLKGKTSGQSSRLNEIHTVFWYYKFIKIALF